MRDWIKSLVQSFDLSANSAATTSLIGLVNFTGEVGSNADVAHVVTELTGSEADILSGIDSLSAEDTLTCISCGIETAQAEWAARGRGDAQQVLILVSDMYQTTAGGDPKASL